ncbi:MAG: hypothetical protein HY925_16890, partial [Elusimicrobia bacterium]|nr:hypothetical protein [Elusimicrobiota bacterium]
MIGPFDRETISQVAGFSAESLVCPEGRKGTQMGDWQRAGVVPEMAEALLAATRTPVLSRAGAERGAGSMLPPEPTLRDLAVLGSLQERVSQLETSSQKMQDELRAKDTEISRLKVELDHKSRSAADMQTKVADLEVKAYGLSSLKDELDRAKDEARVSGVKLEEHQRALEELKEKLSRGTGPAPDPSAIPNMSQAPFPAFPMGAPSAGADSPLGGLGASSVSEPPLGGALSSPSEPPMGGAKSGGMGRIGDFPSPADPFAPKTDAAAIKPPQSMPADPFAWPAASLPPVDAGAEPLVSRGGLGAPPSASAAMAPPLVPVADMAEPSKPRDNKKVLAVVGVMILLVVGGVAMMGGKKKKKKASTSPTLSQPVAPP